MTPEGRVKDAVKKIIAGRKKYGVPIYAHWPVLRGMGSPDLDCNLVVKGQAVSIETKAQGEIPTERQWLTINEKVAAGVIVLITDGDPSELGQIDFVIRSLDSRCAESAYAAAAENREIYVLRRQEREEKRARKKRG